MFQVARLYVRNILSTAISQYYNNNINECKRSQKTVFDIVNKVLLLNQTTVPKIVICNKNMAHDFNNSFYQKVNSIHSSLCSMKKSFPSLGEECCTSYMEAFVPLSDSDIKQLAMKTSNAFCEVDPMPMWLVEKCQAELIKVITSIANISLKAGIFPQSMKAAPLKPLIKKSTLDCNILSNYRPVSNWSFLSKIIERIVASQLSKYFLVNNLNEIQPSAFKCGQSTETALLRVKNDILILHYS